MNIIHFDKLPGDFSNKHEYFKMVNLVDGIRSDAIVRPKGKLEHTYYNIESTRIFNVEYILNSREEIEDNTAYLELIPVGRSLSPLAIGIRFTLTESNGSSGYSRMYQ